MSNPGSAASERGRDDGSGRCPVCRARLGATLCRRCGADLAPIQRLAAAAWTLRQAARAALSRDDPEAALDLATRALALHATPAGRRLRAVAAWTVETTAPDADDSSA